MKLSPAAKATIAGLIGPTEGDEAVNQDGIFPPDGVWDEIRQAFPLDLFHAAVSEGTIDYMEDAGF